MGCLLCPRRCGAARTPEEPGRCGANEGGDQFRVAKMMLHHWEEPSISGSRGSGAVFFSGCSLGCCFCQNAMISHDNYGQLFGLDELTAEIMKLHAQGAHNLNLVTASHYADRIPSLIELLRQNNDWSAKPLPVIWNSSAYETEESLLAVAESVDVWLPDFKFFDTDLSAGLAGAPDYFSVASRAIQAMHRLQPRLELDQDGLVQRGLIIRHLVLPDHWRDSCRLLDHLADNLPLDTPLSLMCQYTPQPAINGGHPELNRRLTTLEYHKVIDHALELGFNSVLGQSKDAASSSYTPDFTVFSGCAPD